MRSSIFHHDVLILAYLLRNLSTEVSMGPILLGGRSFKFFVYNCFHATKNFVVIRFFQSQLLEVDPETVFLVGKYPWQTHEFLQPLKTGSIYSLSRIENSTELDEVESRGVNNISEGRTGLSEGLRVFWNFIRYKYKAMVGIETFH